MEEAMEVATVVDTGVKGRHTTRDLQLVIQLIVTTNIPPGKCKTTSYIHKIFQKTDLRKFNLSTWLLISLHIYNRIV